MIGVVPNFSGQKPGQNFEIDFDAMLRERLLIWIFMVHEMLAEGVRPERYPKKQVTLRLCSAASSR